MVEGDTLVEINKNAGLLIKKLNSYGIESSLDDLQVISELHVW